MGERGNRNLRTVVTVVVGLVEEQETQLAEWAEQYRGQPERELQRLLLLALEREQLVAVAYRDEMLANRLLQLEVPESVRAAFTQALSWAWRDEQQHTVFTRGLLLGGGTAWMRTRAWVQVLMGAVGGWSAATQHHATWRRAPIARAFAAMATVGGRLIGKVPRAMRDKLRHMSFADYCRLQRDAEISASVCWQRIAELGRALDSIDDDTANAFHRMWQHEERHREAFELMAASVDDDGRLRDGQSAERIVAKVRAIGPMFVPREARVAELADHPLGRGGTVVVQDEGEDGPSALRGAIEAAGLREVLDDRARASGRPIAELRVVIKPSFMLAYDRRDRSVFTDPALLDALAAWLREHGVQHVAVAEAPNLYDGLFAGRSVHEVAEYVGLRGDFELVDLQASVTPHDYDFGLGPTAISAAWRDADLRIAFPKLRSHPVDFAHLCLGGLEGIAGRIESYVFSERRAERATATVMPLVEFPPHFAIIDGWDHGADGLVGMIACADPPQPRRIWAGRDTLAVDMIAMRHLGLEDPNRNELLATAITWFGYTDPEVHGPDTALSTWRHPYATSFSALLALAAYPVFQHSSARGSLFAPPMDPSAFPPLRPESALLRLRRASIRRLLRMRAPALPPAPVVEKR